MTETYKKLFDDLRAKANNSNNNAIGYPVNRSHSFPIDFDLLGFKKNSFATTYLNNIASPYEYGTYVSGHIKELEIDLIAKLANHFSLPDDDNFGYVTYGSTEANLAAIWWHRKFLSKAFQSKITIICSKFTHYSIKKIADILDVNFVQIDADEYSINLSDLEVKLKDIEGSIIFVTNFGNTVFGYIDDLISIHSLLKQYKSNQFIIHGDGAIYGLLIPYMSEYNISTSIFDYVNTISFSGHKFLGAYSISGVILTKRSYLKSVFDSEDVKISYIQKAIDVTASGSRQGLYVAELYLLICEAFKNDFNVQRLEMAWTESLKLANWFAEELNFLLLSLKATGKIFHNKLRIVLPAPKSQTVTDLLGQKYGLMPVYNNQLGIYVFPRVTKEYLAQFINDYKIALTD